MAYPPQDGNRGQSSIEDARRGIEQARRKLEQVRRRLLLPTPQAFDASVTVLQAAILSMQQVESKLLSNGEPSHYAWVGIRTEMSLLRHELARVNALAQNAARLYQGRARLLLTDEDAPANYTPAGGSVAGPVNRTLVLHG